MSNMIRTEEIDEVVTNCDWFEKKWFAFSRMDSLLDDVLAKLKLQ